MQPGLLVWRCVALPCWNWIQVHGSLAERSKAPGLGPGPRGRGFESHSYHFIFVQLLSFLFFVQLLLYEPFLSHKGSVLGRVHGRSWGTGTPKAPVEDEALILSPAPIGAAHTCAAVGYN
eukprot:COSAG01_NODE_4330_length_5126_cov_21.673494_5_plen_120_part_00